MYKRQFVQNYLKDFDALLTTKTYGEAFAPSNIALVKYWGKRDTDLNLPVTNSLSLSLGNLGAQTKVCYTDQNHDTIIVNGIEADTHSKFSHRLTEFLDAFRPNPQTFYHVETNTNIPIGAGLASSAAGFAALTLALDDFYNWRLPTELLSIFARLGSGSACRSIYTGFVEWQAGTAKDGHDSYAVPITVTWPELCMAVLVVNDQEKYLSSRKAMQQTVSSSILYQSWPQQVEHDLHLMKMAIDQKDFELLGKTAEQNALAMQATMLASWPPILYNQPESLAIIQAIWQMRANDTPVYFTQDAGPNIKLLFLENDMEYIKACFPNAIMVRPFADIP